MLATDDSAHPAPGVGGVAEPCWQPQPAIFEDIAMDNGRQQHRPEPPLSDLRCDAHGQHWTVCIGDPYAVGAMRQRRVDTGGSDRFDDDVTARRAAHEHALSPHPTAVPAPASIEPPPPPARHWSYGAAAGYTARHDPELFEAAYGDAEGHPDAGTS